MIRRSDEPFSVNERLVNAAIEHAVYLERLKAGEVERIVKLLNREVIPDLLARVQSMLERIRLRGIDGAALGTQRYRDMISALDEIVRVGMKRLGDENAASLFDVARHESAWQVRTFEAAVPREIALEFELPDAGLLRSIVTARPMQGHLLKDWWGELGRSTKRKVQAELNIGLTLGEDVDAIVRRMRGTREARYTDGILQGTRRSVASIVRTSVAHVSSHARAETAKANDDIVKGEKMVATLDLNTTAFCRAIDGQVFPVGVGRRPPFHWGCRTTPVPVLKSWKELGLPFKDLAPSTRASMDGQVPETLTYYDWLAKQSAERQDAVLGPARGAIFRRGKLSPSRFLDELGRPLTLRELDALEARAA